MAEKSEENQNNTLVPVFCTVDIPSSFLNNFLEQVEEYRHDFSFLPRFIDSTANLDSIAGPSKAPATDFESPFDGKSLAEVNKFFVKNIVPLYRFPRSLYVILDKQSIEDKTCLIVNGGIKFDQEDEQTFLRTDFYIAMYMVMQAELGVTNLGENLDRDHSWGIMDIDIE